MNLRDLVNKGKPAIADEAKFAVPAVKVNPLMALRKQVDKPSAGKVTESTPAPVLDNSLQTLLAMEVNTGDTPSANVTDENRQSLMEKTFTFPGQIEEYPQETIDEILRAVNVLENSLTHKELIGDAIKQLVGKLQENPNLRDILAPECFGLMVRGLRENYGRVIATKQVKQQKVTERAKDANEMKEILADFSFDLRM
jgi:hypothetical protein